MQTVKIHIFLKNDKSVTITKESYFGFYDGYIFAEGDGLKNNLLHISENEIYIQNTRLGQVGEKHKIKTAKDLFWEILVKDGDYDEETPWDDIEASEGTIDNFEQLLDYIESLKNISRIDTESSFIDDDDEKYCVTTNKSSDFEIYKGNE